MILIKTDVVLTTKVKTKTQNYWDDIKIRHLIYSFSNIGIIVYLKSKHEMICKEKNNHVRGVLSNLSEMNSLESQKGYANIAKETNHGRPPRSIWQHDQRNCAGPAGSLWRVTYRKRDKQEVSQYWNYVLHTVMWGTSLASTQLKVVYKIFQI